MMKTGWMIGTMAGVMLMAAPALAQSTKPDRQGRAIVTILPAKPGQAATNVPVQDVKIKVSGKATDVTRWTPLRGTESPVELVLLIDGAARASLGTQLSTIKDFIQEMPSNTKMAVAYMMNGRAVMGSRLSEDPKVVLAGLHMPSGMVGISASPYFCLSDLAKNWPSTDRTARREVVMITDGVDNYELRYDPDDPYVQSAIRDSLHAGLVVYSMYWTNRGWVDQTQYENNAGQNLLLEVTQATGGNSYWQGFGNPVSFDPYFKDLRHRLENQYELGFATPPDKGPEVQQLKMKIDVESAKVTAPEKVFLKRAS